MILHSSGSALGGNGYAYDSDGDVEYAESEDEEFINDSDQDAAINSDDESNNEDGAPVKKRKLKPKRIRRRKRPASTTKSKSVIIKDLVKSLVNSSNPEVLVTTYSSIRIYKDVLLPVHWGYAILDEGHKIRNPDADVTITCKQLQTTNRFTSH